MRIAHFATNQLVPTRLHMHYRSGLEGGRSSVLPATVCETSHARERSVMYCLVTIFVVPEWKVEMVYRQRQLLASKACSSNIANTSSNSRTQFGNNKHK